jgi:hypothetical protein
MEEQQALTQLHDLCGEAAPHLNHAVGRELLYLAVTLGLLGEDGNGDLNAGFLEQAIKHAKDLCEQLGIAPEEVA